MRLARRLTVFFFVVIAALFALYTVRDEIETDKVAPVIASDADAIEASVTAEDADLLAGVTAQDDRDGDVSDSLVVVSKSKFIETGTLRVNYAAFDRQGNVGTYSRLLTYTDYTSPRFSLTGPLRYNVETWSYSPLDVVRAEDCLDGDITGLVKYRLEDEDWVYGQTGSIPVVLQVTNSAGDTVQLALEVELLSGEDYEETCPTLTDYLVYTQVGEELSPRSYLRRSDFYDTSDVRVNDRVDYSTPGVYEITYTLSGEGSVVLYVVVEE